jgi:arginyl-tRNA synthetase
MNDVLREELAAALRGLGLEPPAVIGLERPRDPAHGDVTTNVALVLAKGAGRNPRQLAQEILARLGERKELIGSADVAGPGFINFRLTPRFHHDRLREVIQEGPSFGRSAGGAGKRAQVEFVSANPTGPLTVGHGRGAVLGDTVANLLEWTGWDVTREYYYNNAGRQMRILGDSVRLRYLQELGDDAAFPEDYYQGEYIREIARALRAEAGEGLREEPAEGRFKRAAEEEIFADIRRTLSSLGIVFRSFFNENSLYDDGKIREVIGEFRARGHAYEKEGALWLKTSALGGEKDKVIVKSTGEPTYRLPDIAYHREKLRAGYDLIIDVFGADHIATYPDVLAGLQALGFDTARIRVLIHQFVTIVQGGEAVKMSTRKANFITLDELVAEVGADVARYFFLMRAIGTHLNFDLALAKEQSDENPVFYLQYAHARISGILRHAAEKGLVVRPAEAPLELLTASEEMDLLKLLLEFPGLVESCALSCEPHRLAEYLHTVAGLFHRFYHEHRVVTEDAQRSSARLALCEGTRTVMRNGLAVLGIGAPEKM